jgi:hypothetical protein
MWWIILIGCGTPAAMAPDLTERLSAGEVRAGVITDESALFGGISAEGRAGDLLIYNDRVRFVIQAARDGDYYVGQGGGVIDADIVRPEGQLGRDAVDEWSGMYGLGRLLDPESVVVVSDGADGEAVIRVEGVESPMKLLNGTVGAEVVPMLGLRMAVEYRLKPDAQWMEVETELSAGSADATLQPGDALFGALEAVEPWDPGVGLDTPGSNRPYTGLLGKDNDIAYAIAAVPGETLASGVADVLSTLVQVATGSGPTVTIPAGTSSMYRRYYGVGRDLASLTDGLLTESEVVEGTVTAADGPVAGARVNVLVDDAPYTLAVTDADGRYYAKVPRGRASRVVADGRGAGYYLDLPAGYTHFGPYGADGVRAATLAAFAGGAAPVPAAIGRGVATPDAPTTLGVPGVVVVTADDGLPFEARLAFVSPDAEVDRRLFAARPAGYASVGWARDGEVRIPVEPGRYTLIVQRGIRYELEQRTVDVEAGKDLPVTVHLEQAYTADGYLLGDPHMHASPSGDVTIPMEDRLIGAAGVGLQLHFGTDHDHIADYRPMLEPLGLSRHLATVVSDEVSPVLRGHTNIYPISSVPGQPNLGAFRWWAEPIASTDAQYSLLRERHGDISVQINHPTGQGLATAAGWAPGTIARDDRWSTAFDAVEVENSGEIGSFLSFYWDVLLRGVIATPTGVSDAHNRIGAGLGLSATFFGMGTSDPAAYSDDALREAMRARRTIVTRGPFLRLSVDPGATVAAGTTVHATAVSPSWIKVDRLLLVRDGVTVETVAGTDATFVLSPEVDAAYAIVAEGDTPMQPLFGETPWAMSSPYLVDVGADGWIPPLPAFTVGN